MIPFKITNIFEDEYKSLKIVTTEQGLTLFVNGESWMTYHPCNNQIYQMYSHNYYAYGDVIATGLGFGLRELMLLDNEKVKSVTVIERSQDLIEWHQIHNKPLMDKINVVCSDANDVRAKCDVLLLDHYEHAMPGDFDKIYNNIEHNLFWYWPAELTLNYELVRRKYPTLPKYDKRLFAMFKHLCYYMDDV